MAASGMRLVNSGRAVVAILLVALGLSAAACLLPDDPYQRWQLLNGTIHANARWIYERTHFDPRPIDVAFIGPSRTEMGVNAPRLERDLAARGLDEHVINASLPQEGRNIEDVIVREILSAKHPRLIVLGVTEKPSRFGHPAFKFIAPAWRVVDPGYLTDFHYFSDLVYLPYRQMRLFAARFFPSDSLSTRFDPARYRGESVQTTGSRMLGDGHFQDGDHPGDPVEVSQRAMQFAASMHPPLFHGRVEGIEFGDERANLRDIAALARAHGVKIALLYLPYYDARPHITEQAFYRGLGPIWAPDFLASRVSLYFDYGHLDKEGSDLLTDWLAGRVADELGPPGPPDATGRPVHRVS
jgi:hypothetical protein